MNLSVGGDIYVDILCVFMRYYPERKKEAADGTSKTKNDQGCIYKSRLPA